MPTHLPQKYQAVAKELIPYETQEPHQLAIITFEPALPCVLCSRPATTAIIAPAPEQSPGASRPWLTFPICAVCEERQVRTKKRTNP